jgi:hypothetical protein
VDEKNMDHQPNDFARREVVASRFVGQFIKTADEVLENQPHLLVGHSVRVEVDVAEFGHHQIENVGFPHLFYFVLELEVLEDATHVRRKALDVADEVLGYVIGVALQFFKIERRVVVEALARRLVELGVQCLAFELTAPPFVFGHDLPS